MCWATAASLLVCLVESSNRVFSLGKALSSGKAPAGSTRTASPLAALPVRSAVHRAERPSALPSGALPSGALGHGMSVLFVAGQSRDVRFRVDLRDGTVATPRATRVLDRVVAIALSERIMFLCQATGSTRTQLRVVGFDLHTGTRTKAALASAGAASVDPDFCEDRRSSAEHALRGWGYFTALQMSLERQATILPKVSNGDAQSSFLISSRHSFSSLTTMPPGQS